MQAPRVAGDVYDVVYSPPSRARRAGRVVLVLVANLFSDGTGPVNPGGGRHRIVERSSGREVGRVKEWFGDDDFDSEISADLHVLSPEEFIAKWGEAAPT